MTGSNLLADAIISPCGLYRYRLSREWIGALRTCCFVMLNPSTADEHGDDPTIRRCLSFALRFDCSRLEVVNLYALRATDPAELWNVEDPVGPENDRHIFIACQTADIVICAWGGNAKSERVREVLRLLPEDALCFGHTKTGNPRHPLYLRSDTPLVPLEHLPPSKGKPMSNRKPVLNSDLPSPVLQMLNSLTDRNVDKVWLYFDSNDLESIAVALKMAETRAYLIQLWGEEEYYDKMRPLVEALRKVADETNRDPFLVAIDEAKRAGVERKEGVVWQLTAAACEIAEGRLEGPAIAKGE